MSIVAVAARSKISVSAGFGTGMMQCAGAARLRLSAATLANLGTLNQGVFRRDDRSRHSRASFDEGVTIQKSACANERPGNRAGKSRAGRITPAIASEVQTLPGLRTRAGHSLEPSSQMGLVYKTAGQSNGLQGQAAIEKHVLSLGDLVFECPSMWRQTC